MFTLFVVKLDDNIIVQRFVVGDEVTNLAILPFLYVIADFITMQLIVSSCMVLLATQKACH